jgi:hypothetical protein
MLPTGSWFPVWFLFYQQDIHILSLWGASCCVMYTYTFQIYLRLQLREKSNTNKFSVAIAGIFERYKDIHIPFLTNQQNICLLSVIIKSSAGLLRYQQKSVYCLWLLRYNRNFYITSDYYAKKRRSGVLGWPLKCSIHNCTQLHWLYAHYYTICLGPFGHHKVICI